MAVTVTSFVPPTVNTTHVTLNRAPVLGVSLDGRGYTVTQVGLIKLYILASFEDFTLQI